MSKRWKTSNDYLKALVLPLLVFACLLLFLITGVESAGKTADLKGYEFLQAAVLEATVQCYAIEGMYPPDVAYLEDHYGIRVDMDKYIVHYEAFAANILPNIVVIQK